jgi:nitrite reductase/ring-hydroxylating ferredoxin subunit
MSREGSQSVRITEGFPGRHWLRFLIAVAAVGGAALLIDSYRSPTNALTLGSLPDGGSVHKIEGVDVFLVKKGAGVRGFLDSAPHLGERLWWCTRERVFLSPAHGELFDQNGRLINGPAQRDLDRVKTTVTADHVVEVDPRILEPGTIRNGVGLRSAGVSPGVWAAYQVWIHNEAGDRSFCQRHIGAEGSTRDQ